MKTGNVILGIFLLVCSPLSLFVVLTASIIFDSSVLTIMSFVVAGIIFALGVAILIKGREKKPQKS